MGFAIGGAIIVGGLIAANASQNASSSQTGAADRATGVQSAEYQQTRKDQAPWREAGEGALGKINANMDDYTKNFSMADFQKDPGYQFRMDEGNKAIERSAAAKGGLNSGGTMKALTRYSQGVASDEYQSAYNRFNTDRSNSFNRLASLAGIGQTANNAIGQSGQNMANNVSQNIIGAGNANAAAQMNQSNSINQGIGQGMNSWMNYSMMNRMFPQENSPSGSAVDDSSGNTGTYYDTGGGLN